MTATRMSRAGRVRFFIVLGIMVLTLGFIAMFHSSQQQLDASRRLEIRCEQQQEALSLQVEELETKLKLEKQRFEQLRQSLEREAREQTDLKDKSVQEINAKYESLQQQYKFLNSQLEDNKEDNTRDKAKQTKEMADLVAKVKSLQAQATDKDKSSAAWKAKYDQLLQEKQTLEALGGADADDVTSLRKQLVGYQANCAWRPPTGSIVGPSPLPAGSSSPALQPERSFNAQIPLIPKPLVNNDPLARPPTPSTDRKTPDDAADVGGAGDKVNVAPNAPMPEPMRASPPTQANAKRGSESAAKHPKPVPVGILPILPVDDMLGKEAAAGGGAAAGDADKAVNNNRYQNAIDDIDEKNANALKGLQGDTGDTDIGAHEVNDPDDFVMEDRNHQGHLGDDKADAVNANNNAAEEDLYEHGGGGNRAGGAVGEKAAAGDDEDLQVIHQGGNNERGDRNELGGEAKRDQGVAYQDTGEQGEMADDGDDDDYLDKRNKDQEPAVRNRR